MKELRVLILTGIHLSPLPQSITCLTKLRMLCLEKCTLGEQLSLIGKLKKLRILTFSGSDIESLPVELNQLSKLQIFDISNCSKLRVIPADVISSLTSLEELYMRNVSIQWRVHEGQENQSENVSLSELGYLNQLTSLDIQIPSVSHLPQNLFFDNLNKYKIVIGSSNRYFEPDFEMPEKYELSRSLAIQQKDGFGIHSQKGIKMLFERVENLLLENLNGVKDIFYELNLKGFLCLQHLSIVSNYGIRSLIKPKERKHPERVFPKLESLYLYKLKNMEQICSSSCHLSKSSFGKLKIIKIKLCGQLKNVFLISTVTCLTALETIQVSECNSLKEIVPEETQENADEVELKFPELRSLTLHSLPKFIGFYPISSAGETNILFHKKVVVSKLERMELSSIQINQIWIDQCSHFQNLIHLDVNGCWKLEYLFSFSMAKNLVKLQSLFVSVCVKMERIFSQDTDAKMKLDSIFPNLKNIKLSNMKSLSEIWSSKVPRYSFGKLDTLIIEKCDKFVNVSPRYMEKVFQSLGSLKVTNCKSMNAIFDLADQKQDARVVTNLQDVHLETLPQLEHVLKWKKDQKGILELTNLQKFWVQNCHKLENIFPVSVAKTLENLEYLMVWDCFFMREIVAKGDANNNPKSTISFEFPRLTTIKFLKLPKFNSFYPGAYELSCPELNDLSVELCDKLDPFREDTPDAQRKPVLFPEKVINKLKSMQIESWHVKSSTNYDYRRDNLEDLCLSKLNDTNILYSFLHHNPSLESIWLNDCSFEELVPLERPPKIDSLGVVPKLKNLKLTGLPNLKNICFERDTILQRIEFLTLKNCPSLDTIALSTISLSFLTNLELADCKGLKYLMHPSTAKSLGKLRNMKVINCESLEVIVLEQRSEAAAATGEVEEGGGGGGQNAGKVDIIFRQLKALELVSLKNLKSFCSSKSCVFEFPSLEKVVVSACPKMENFSQNFPQEVQSTPILQKVYVVQENEKRWCWEGNLQATIQYMFKNKKYFEGMAILDVSEHLDHLEQVWQGKGGLRKDFCYSLNTLKLDKCKFESYAIRPNVLRCLKSLKELEVRNCDNIIGIFEMDDTKHWGTSFSMKKLTLEKLPDVTHVWGHDKQGIPSFHNLQQVTVTDCKKLKTLFPAAPARNLKMLEKLEVIRCVELLEIVGKEGEAAEGTEEKFVFPLLTELALRVLPKLTHFYSERFTLECPELNVLRVTGCNNFELFQSQQEACPESQGNTSIIRQPLFSDIKGISKVEELYLSWKGISWLGQPTDQGLQHLHQLMLLGSRSSTLPIEILDKTPNLKRMDMYDSESLKKLFPSPNPQNGNEVLGNLQTLFLVRLSKLQSMEGLEYLSKLRLYVKGCPGLTTLAQSCSNVKYLRIGECDGLECLFTSSAAKMSIHLVDMDIWGCKSMKEIVGKEHDDEIETEDIKFEWLERIKFQSLSKLECFYSGNNTLYLPSLIRVDMVKCRKMKIFSQGLIHAESSRGVLFSYAPNDDLVFHRDLNTAVGQWILHETHLVLADYPEAEGLWTGRVPIPSDISFNKLRTLKVEGCKFLSNVVLPSHLLSLLRNLEELVVRECNSVEAIFDVENTSTPDDSYIIVIPLKKLTLQQLPTLRHVWNEDPKGRLNFPLLKEVFVKECKSIKSLFPTSVAKDKLQKLDVINCVELVEVVAKDEGAKEETIVEVTMFPSLTWLQLWNLPNMRCICSGMQNLNWPLLRNLIVSYCRNLKIFATDFQNSPDSHSEGQDRFTTDNQQGFVSAGKVFAPYLEQLSLNKEDAVMIEQRRLHVDLQKMKTLILHSFNDESDTFPHVFFLEMPLPSIQGLQMTDSAFEEIFPSQRPDLDHYEILSKLKRLELHVLPKLKSIGLERAWMAPLLENLEYLRVWSCTCLTNLAPSTVSLSHLTRLQVEHCVGLEYLFTSSTAKSLVVLREMSITKCESLEKVVAEEGEQPDEDVIFTELTTLSLSQLPKLESFYTGSSTMDFPCLKDISLTECKSMKTFSHGNVVAPSVCVVKVDGICCSGDLNAAVCQQIDKGSSPKLA